MKRRPFNSRTFQGSLERELVGGGILVALLVGGGLIYLIWGQAAALTALACLVLLLGLAGMIWGFLALAGKLGGSD